MTDPRQLEWRPGSFTKNFGWGTTDRGLSELHSIIRIGFDGRVEDTARSKFRERVKAAGKIDYIPLNFFLFNRHTPGGDTLVADELVFQAIEFRHSKRFDKLALFAFNLSIVGSWRGSEEYQQRPALWSHFYVSNRLAAELHWDLKQVSANDIEKFVLSDSRYHAKTARKLATNLAYLYRLGRLYELGQRSMDRWWIDCVFLALDRVMLDLELRKQPRPHSALTALLASDFNDLTGPRSTEKDLALPHLVQLYDACGGTARFSADEVRARTELLLPDLAWYAANDPSPLAAIHRSNPNLVKSIPRACALLARHVAHFETLDWDDLINFDVNEFVRTNVNSALGRLKDRGIRPSASAEDLLKLFRDDEE